MTRRTVMAGQFGPASLRNGARSVYVCLPDTTSVHQHERISVVLAGLVRASDRLLYAPAANTAAPVIAFAEKYGNPASSIVDERPPPDLILIVIDPLGDNASALEARALATHGNSDIVIAELPELIRTPL